MSKNRFELLCTTVISRKGTVIVETSMSKEQLEKVITEATENHDSWDLLGFTEELRKFADVEVTMARKENSSVDNFDVDNIKAI